MGAGSAVDPSTYAAMLATLRRRRRYFWGLVLIYLPAMITILKLSPRATATAFGAWVAFLCVAVGLLACAKCPACNKNFHMRNASLSFSSNCRHCGINYRQ